MICISETWYSLRDHKICILSKLGPSSDQIWSLLRPIMFARERRTDGHGYKKFYLESNQLGDGLV